jgi:ribosome biogenesis protein BRX1
LYISPSRYRQQIRLSAKNKYLNRLQQKVHASTLNSAEGYKMTPLDDIFQGDPLEKAQEIQQNVSNDEAGEEKTKVKLKTVKRKKKIIKKKK